MVSKIIKEDGYNWKLYGSYKNKGLALTLRKRLASKYLIRTRHYKSTGEYCIYTRKMNKKTKQRW